MRNRQVKWLAGCVGACVLAGTVMAQVETLPPRATTDRDTTATRSDTTKSTHYFPSKDLVGTNVKDAQGQKLGEIRELYFNPQTGAAFAAIDIDGSRDAVVPLQGLRVSHVKGVLKDSTEITVNKSKSDLESGPTLASDEWSKLDDPNFTRQVYTTYNLRMPSAMGGAETPGGAATGTRTYPQTVPKHNSDLK